MSLCSSFILHLNFIVSEAETQQFTLITKKDEPLKKIELKNSADNNIYFEYMKFISKKTKESELIKLEKDSLIRLNKLIALDNEVKNEQSKVIKKREKKGFAAFIKSTIDVESPQYLDEKDVEKRRFAQYFYIKQHYFDNIDLKNDFLLRTPTLFPKINYYIEKLTSPHSHSAFRESR